MTISSTVTGGILESYGKTADILTAENTIEGLLETIHPYDREPIRQSPITHPWA
jgi:hypothetical protein